MITVPTHSTTSIAITPHVTMTRHAILNLLVILKIPHVILNIPHIILNAPHVILNAPHVILNEVKDLQPSTF
jgi:hypothetical protein